MIPGQRVTPSQREAGQKQTNHANHLIQLVQQELQLQSAAVVPAADTPQAVVSQPPADLHSLQALLEQAVESKATEAKKDAEATKLALEKEIEKQKETSTEQLEAALQAKRDAEAKKMALEKEIEKQEAMLAHQKELKGKEIELAESKAQVTYLQQRETDKDKMQSAFNDKLKEDSKEQTVAVQALAAIAKSQAEAQKNTQSDQIDFLKQSLTVITGAVRDLRAPSPSSSSTAGPAPLQLLPPPSSASPPPEPLPPGWTEVPPHTYPGVSRVYYQNESTGQTQCAQRRNPPHTNPVHIPTEFQSIAHRRYERPRSTLRALPPPPGAFPLPPPPG